MNQYANNLIRAANQLRELFKDGGTLTGFDEWDAMIGCVILIENTAAALRQLEQREPEPAETEQTELREITEEE